MDKKTVGGLVILVVILGFVVGFYIHYRNIPAPETVAQAQASSSETKPTCNTNNSSLKIDSQDNNNIQIAAVSHLSNVPAGTNADVNINSYTPTTTTGSVIYPKSYGSYNFKMRKVSGNTKEIPWQITSFVACKR
jgi:hypothetical protein